MALLADICIHGIIDRGGIIGFVGIMAPQCQSGLSIFGLETEEELGVAVEKSKKPSIFHKDA